MKILLTIAVLFFIPSIQADTFSRAINASCFDLDRGLKTAEATEVANLQRDGKIDLERFFKTYQMTCEFDIAKEVAVNMKDGLVGVSTINKVLNGRCTDYMRSVQSSDLKKFDAIADQDNLEMRKFLKAYALNCRFNAEAEIAVKDFAKMHHESPASSNTLGNRIDNSERSLSNDKNDHQQENKPAQVINALSR